MRRHKLRKAAVIGAALIVPAIASGQAQALTIRIAGTSDITDSNLFAAKMQTLYSSSPYFVAGDTLQYTAAGTGAALTSAEQGFADVVLVHSPPLEKNFVTQGYSYEPLGRSLFYNDYVVVGPSSDPANVHTLAPHDAAKAFQLIAQAGAAGTASFISRNDRSGTNVQEETMWGQINGTGVPLQTAQNAQGVPNLYQPAASTGSTAYPVWYVRQTAAVEQHQGANLLSTSACKSAFAPQQGCYTITDRGTYDYLVGQNGGLTGLTIVSQYNASGTTGGVTELINPFHGYIVTPIDPATGGTYPYGQTPNVTAATRFLNFLTGATGASGATGKTTYTPTFQNELTTYLTPTGTTPVFEPDAFPLTQSPNPTSGNHNANGGTNVSVSANLYYAPPQTTLDAPLPISGIPYQINVSTNGGSTWTTIKTGNTNSAGLASDGSYTLPTGSGTVVQFELTTPGYYDDSALQTRFSPNDNTGVWGTYTIN